MKVEGEAAVGFPAKEMFDCTKLRSHLQRSACALRHQAAQRTGWRNAQLGKSLRSQACRVCTVGKEHSEGTSAVQWEDGAEVRVVEPPKLVHRLKVL